MHFEAHIGIVIFLSPGALFLSHGQLSRCQDDVPAAAGPGTCAHLVLANPQYANTAFDPCSCRRGLPDQRFIQRVTTEAQGLERQRRLDEGIAKDQVDALDRCGAQSQRIDSKLRQMLVSLDRKELAADLVMGSGFSFDQVHALTGARQQQSGRAACKTTAEDQCIRHGDPAE